MDSLTELPEDNDGNDTVFVVMDMFSKRAVFISLSKPKSTQIEAHLLQSHVFCKHGTPCKFISDKVFKFRSKFGRVLPKFLI